MPAGEGNVTVYVPLSTDVVVKGFANATNLQRIAVQPPVGDAVVFQGTGERNAPIGRTRFTTPASGGPPAVGISVEHSHDGGSTWTPSELFTDSCLIHTYHLVVVVSEDDVDGEYSEAVCMVSWPQEGS